MANHPIGDMMDAAMDKIRTMVDSSTVVGQPITTPDGVTLIPVSRISFGFASGGSDSSASSKAGVWGGSGAAVKMEPIGFLMIQEGSVRMVGIQMPAITTADRVIDMLPDVLDRVEGYVDRFSSRGEKTNTDD